MSSRNLQPLSLRELNYILCFGGVQGKRLLDVNMTPGLKTKFRNLVMALGRSRDVDHVRLSMLDKIRHVAVASLHWESLRKLLRHERFAVANADDRTSGYPCDLRSMRVRNFSTPNDCDLKHLIRSQHASK